MQQCVLQFALGREWPSFFFLFGGTKIIYACSKANTLTLCAVGSDVEFVSNLIR